MDQEEVEASLLAWFFFGKAPIYTNSSSTMLCFPNTVTHAYAVNQGFSPTVSSE